MRRIFLILILFLAFFFRFYQLGNIPFGFFCDEASVGYNAYSLANTGTDEWGVKWPLFFKAFVNIRVQL
jgi:predicted membrane-bound mannosyltransferase